MGVNPCFATGLTAVPPRSPISRRLFDKSLRLCCTTALGVVILHSTTGCRWESAEPPTSVIVELTDANFQREVIETEQPVLVEFWAPWCEPCVDMMPAMEQVAHEFSGRAKVGKLRIDENEDIASTFDVQSPPAVIVFRNGAIFKRRSGKQTESELQSLLAESLAD